MSELVSAPQPKPPLGLLAWIALYKFVKALVSLGAALFVLNLLHKDLAKVALEWTELLGMNPQGRWALWLLEHLTRLNPRRIQFISAVLLAYMAMYLTEGIGLFLEQRWAEWLTVVQTALLVPWEVYELARYPDWVKTLVLGLNLAVIAYLIWRMRRDEWLKAQARTAAFDTPKG